MRHKKRGTLRSVPLFLRLASRNHAGHLKISRPRQYLPSWDGPFLLPAYPPVPAAYPLPQTTASEAALPLKAFPPEVPVLRSGGDSPPCSATPGTCQPDQNKSFRRMEGVRGRKGQFLQKTPLPLSSPLLHGSHNTHPPKTTAAPKGRRDEGMTRGRPRPHRGHGRPACYSISSVRIMWRAAAVSSRRRTGIFTGASSSCWGSDLPRATISRRASM